MLDLLTATPAQIDAAWAEGLIPIERKFAQAWFKRNEAKSCRDYATRNSYRNDEYTKKATELDEEAQSLSDEATAEKKVFEVPFLAEWQVRSGWTRAYKVTNLNGHIHSDMDCSTCYDSTQFAWITELSGHDTGEIADLAGEMACTVCYPNAPVNKPTRIFTPDEKSKAEAKVEREAKQAAKAAEKVAKSIVDVDGSPLLDNMGWEVKTEREARIRLVDTIVDFMSDAETPWPNQELAATLPTSIDRIAEAIAHKHDIAVADDIIEEATAKAEKKFDKQKRDWAKDFRNPINQH